VGPPVKIVLPIRYAYGLGAVQATTRLLSAYGAFIRAHDPLRAGLRLSLRLYFPDGRPEELIGVVDPLGPRPEEESGFWVRFEAVPAQARERLARALAGRAEPAPAEPHQAPRPQVQTFAPRPPAQPSHRDQRSTPRKAARLRTRFGSVAALREEVSHNVSAGGMFIATERPPALRELVLLQVELPGEEAPLEVLAEVMHVVGKEQATAQLPAGVGVQFVGAGDEFRERLDRYLARHEE
jgi:uncharacterized protein (TIGR02266 family)